MHILQRYRCNADEIDIFSIKANTENFNRFRCHRVESPLCGSSPWHMLPSDDAVPNISLANASNWSEIDTLILLEDIFSWNNTQRAPLQVHSAFVCGCTACILRSSNEMRLKMGNFNFYSHLIRKFWEFLTIANKTPFVMNKFVAQPVVIWVRRGFESTIVEHPSDFDHLRGSKVMTWAIRRKI